MLQVCATECWFASRGERISPYCWFNLVDAAAKKVIETKGRKSITIMPLDVTTKLIVTKDLVEQITQPAVLAKLTAHLPQGPYSQYPKSEVSVVALTARRFFYFRLIHLLVQVGKAMFLADLATFLIKSNMGFRCTQGHTGFLVHDASTLAFLFYPETVRLTRGRVKVGLVGYAPAIESFCNWAPLGLRQVSTSEDVQGRTHLDMRHLPKTPGTCCSSGYCFAVCSFWCLDTRVFTLSCDFLGGSFVALDVDADAVLTAMVQDLMAAFNESSQQTNISEFVLKNPAKLASPGGGAK